MKQKLISTLGLKGSWAWAKKQMRAGKVVRCKSWSGALKLRIDSKENQLLQACYRRNSTDTLLGERLWESSNHHLSYEDFSDYEIVEGWEGAQQPQKHQNNLVEV